MEVTGLSVNAQKLSHQGGSPESFYPKIAQPPRGRGSLRLCRPPPLCSPQTCILVCPHVTDGTRALTLCPVALCAVSFAGAEA